MKYINAKNDPVKIPKVNGKLIKNPTVSFSSSHLVFGEVGIIWTLTTLKFCSSQSEMDKDVRGIPSMVDQESKYEVGEETSFSK